MFAHSLAVACHLGQKECLLNICFPIQILRCIFSVFIRFSLKYLKSHSTQLLYSSIEITSYEMMSLLERSICANPELGLYVRVLRFPLYEFDSWYTMEIINSHITVGMVRARLEKTDLYIHRQTAHVSTSSSVWQTMIRSCANSKIWRYLRRGLCAHACSAPILWSYILHSSRQAQLLASRWNFGP